MNKLNLYLAHPTKNRHEIRKWEKEFESEHPEINLINPFYDNPENRRDVLALDKGKRYIEEPDYADRIVERDLRLLGKQDGILMIANDEISIGSPIELAYSKIMEKFPRCVIGLNGLHNHPWAVHYSTHMFKSFKEFENRASEFINQQLKK